MNNLPFIIYNTGRYPPEFQQVLQTHSLNFVGRGFVWSAISNFLQRYDRGYLTIVGTPGSGKSAILAKYVRDNPQVVYYNAQVAGKNRADVFLAFLCTQFTPPTAEISLQSLLQHLSNQLAPQQRLIIAIDGVDAIDRRLQSPGSNLFYLPRYLPQGVYFLLCRRPFLSSKSGLLLETPAQILDLREYAAENQQDVQMYIRSHFTPLAPVSDAVKRIFRDDAAEFITQMTAEGENNFMYVSQILAAMTEGFYTQTLNFDLLPSNLIAYYQQHLQKMIPENLVEAERELILSVLQVLVQTLSPISASSIAQIIDADEYDVEAVLESWLEFLTIQQINQEVTYNLYHSSFRRFLSQQTILG
jgi:hypothetical protein